MRQLHASPEAASVHPEEQTITQGLVGAGTAQSPDLVQLGGLHGPGNSSAVLLPSGQLVYEVPTE